MKCKLFKSAWFSLLNTYSQNKFAHFTKIATLPLLDPHVIYPYIFGESREELRGITSRLGFYRFRKVLRKLSLAMIL